MSISNGVRPSTNKRRAPRQKGNSFLELHQGDGRLITGIGRIENFSTSGVCFSTAQILKRGECIHAELRILGQGHLDIVGKIVWVKRKQNGFVYGVRFESAKPRIV